MARQIALLRVMPGRLTDLKNASLSAALLLAPHDLKRVALDSTQVTFAVACKRGDNLGKTMAPIFHDSCVVVACDLLPCFVERLAK
jgi:hypothetical protein